MKIEWTVFDNKVWEIYENRLYYIECKYLDHDFHPTRVINFDPLVLAKFEAIQLTEDLKELLFRRYIRSVDKSRIQRSHYEIVYNSNSNPTGEESWAIKHNFSKRLNLLMIEIELLFSNLKEALNWPSHPEVSFLEKEPRCI